VRRFLAQIANLFRGRAAEHEMSREIETHVALLEENFRARGLPAEEAKLAARRVYGGIEQAKELHREARTLVWVEHLLKDLRYGIRNLLHAPGFTAVAVLTLALGIGANTAIFTLLHAALWKPLPVEHPEEIYHLMRMSTVGDFAGEFSTSYPLFQQFAKSARPWGEVFATNQVGSKKFG